ncbi:MAG: DUF2264 domain-containing protein [Opitutales bacterium]|nr:DUF2264 domain-containing protein [Opitutales bacterium]
MTPSSPRAPAAPLPFSLACPDLSRRAGWEELTLRYWQAAQPYLAEKRGHWAIPYQVARHVVRGAGMEGWSRQLWALVPLIAGGGPFPDSDRLRGDLIAGTDPESPSYWGAFGDYDQRMVECAVIGAALRICPEVFWDPLIPSQRERLVDFLSPIVRHTTPDNNWLFFRILVMCGLRHVGVPVDEERARASLDRIEEFALDDRWYGDGPNKRIDYYNGTGFHFYGLLYSQWEAARDPARAARFRGRAERFAASFVRWFDAGGAALPYGRSLTYRFAQGSFWSALAWAGGGPFSRGQLKGLINRHMRWWQALPIHTRDGVLTRGYGYPQDAMTETYNALGSPAWGFKAFWHLLLPADDPFWAAEEEPLPADAGPVVQAAPRMVLANDRAAGHVVAASAGPVEVAAFVRHFEEKYAKLAYSTQLAFAVPTARRPLSAMAPDSTLLVRRPGDSEYGWRPRGVTHCFEHGDNWVRSTWQVDAKNCITTTLRLVGGAQEREHVFAFEEPWEVVEGAFCVPFDEGSDLPGGGEESVNLRLTGGGWSCTMERLEGGGHLTALDLEPGSHLIFPQARTVIRQGSIPAGKTRWRTRVHVSRP